MLVVYLGGGFKEQEGRNGENGKEKEERSKQMCTIRLDTSSVLPRHPRSIIGWSAEEIN